LFAFLLFLLLFFSFTFPVFSYLLAKREFWNGKAVLRHIKADTRENNKIFIEPGSIIKALAANPLDMYPRRDQQSIPSIGRTCHPLSRAYYEYE
jgi:hypothetical protein